MTKNTKCVNGHFLTGTFDQMQLKCKNNPNYFCQICKNKNDQKLYYCPKCFKFYCYNHGKKVHDMKDGHKIYFNDSYDNICFEHNGNTLVGYCANDNKNYCLRCDHYEENNNKIDEELTKEQINKYEKEYDNNKKMIGEIDKLLKNFKNAFKDLESNYILFRQNIFKKNEFIKELINIYKKNQSESTLNYQMKANIEINHFDLTQKMQNINSKFNAQIREINEIIKIFKSKEEPNK